MVLNVALTKCIDPSGNSVNTSGMTLGLLIGVVASYIFLGTFVWTWLGHSVFLRIPIRQDKKWQMKSLRILKPFTKLRTVAMLYAVACIVSLGAAVSLSAGVANCASLCGSQTPLLLSFSTFSMIVYWIAIGITGGRLFTVVKGDEIRAKLKEQGLAGNSEPTPENDVDMVRLIFKRFDHEGHGFMESSDLGAFLELLGVRATPDDVAQILVCSRLLFASNEQCVLTVHSLQFFDHVRDAEGGRGRRQWSHIADRI
jgi:hypothetical protein